MSKFISDEKQKELDDLEKRIETARKSKTNEINIKRETEENSPEAKKSARAGSEFLANIFAGALLGYGIDWYFGTTPWAMIFFILAGFISGVYRANAAMKESYKENDK